MVVKIHLRFPDYEIHSDGRVFRVLPAKIGRWGYDSKIGEVFGRVLKSGYRQFKLSSVDGNQVLIRANRLICETFHGQPPTSIHQAAHSNGARLDNRADNLRWATPRENNEDRRAHGTMLRGCDVSTAALTPEQLTEVRSSFTGMRGQIKELARKYGTGYSTMNRIVHGYTYSALDRRANI